MSNILVLIPGIVLLLVLLTKIRIKLGRRRCLSHTCLTGKTALITGANTGIGYETALDLAKRGARVILACRDEIRANQARTNIIRETANDNVVVKLVDLASFRSVRAFAADINASEERLDILVNNAGAAGLGDVRSEDGHELLMQVNYFSHFLLTVLLVGLLKRTGNSRVVNVSSIGAKRARNFDIAKIDRFPGRFQEYFHTKLCNILFTIELAKKLKASGVTTYSLHPGAVETEIFRHLRGFWKVLIAIVVKLLFLSSEEGAQTTIYCSVARDIEYLSGQHFDNCGRVDHYKSVNVDVSGALWTRTEEIVQLTPQENPFANN